MAIAWHVVRYCMGMVGLSMGGHERPYGSVPKTWD